MREPTDGVPANKFLFAGIVPSNKVLFAGTVLANKFLFAGTVPANNLFHKGINRNFLIYFPKKGLFKLHPVSTMKAGLVERSVFVSTGPNGHLIIQTGLRWTSSHVKSLFASPTLPLSFP